MVGGAIDVDCRPCAFNSRPQRFAAAIFPAQIGFPAIDPDRCVSSLSKDTANGCCPGISAARDCLSSFSLFWITAGLAAHLRHRLFSRLARS